MGRRWHCGKDKSEGPAGWAVHPGEILREEFLEPMGISAYRLAVELHVSAPTVSNVVRERRGITPEMAARLSRYFGNSEQFWLNLQDAFALHQVRRKYRRELAAIRPVSAYFESATARHDPQSKFRKGCGICVMGEFEFLTGIFAALMASS